MTTAGLGARVAAYRAVRRVHSTGAWAQRAVDGALRGAVPSLDARDRAFAANLAYQTLRWEGTLDWALRRVVTRPLTAVQPEVLDVLRLGTWELLQGAAPDHSAVGTAVEVARAEIGSQTTGFVNGVLRGLARGKEAIPWPAEDTDEGLGLVLGYPAWIVGEARAVFSDRARAVLAAGNDAPGLTLRAAPPGSRDRLIAELAASGHAARPGRAAPDAIAVPGADPATLPAVAQGRAAPQDEASMLVVMALAGAAGDLAGRGVLDACAAPGGKSTHLAALGAHVTATDLHPGRARQVTEAAARLGASERVLVAAADATRPPFRPDSFDAVLLDAPCTGLGVVRRRPELRWRREAADPARLSALQVGLLEACARLVRPGGVLVYSVCTWTAAETVVAVRAFLAAEGDRFTVVDPGLPAGRPAPSGPGILLDPDADGVDGMYICTLARGGG